MSAFPPSAATVKARKILFCAVSGNFSKLFRAALTHEMGLVSLLVSHYGAYMTPVVNRNILLSVMGACSPAL